MNQPSIPFANTLHAAGIITSSDIANEVSSSAGMAGVEPVRKALRLVEVVVDTLSHSMENGELHIGEKLPSEAELMRTLGVSRTVIREAISCLQAAGRVVTRHGVGTFVLQPHPEENAFIAGASLVTIRDVIDLMELRVSLETEAAALAALRRNDSHLAAMHTAVALFTRSLTKGELAVQPDVNFHMQIALATGNHYFEQAYTSLGAVTVPRTRIDTALLAEQRQEHYLTRTNHEHEDILNAIARQDAEGARAGMRTHLVNSIERLKRVADKA